MYMLDTILKTRDGQNFKISEEGKTLSFTQEEIDALNKVVESLEESKSVLASKFLEEFSVKEVNKVDLTLRKVLLDATDYAFIQQKVNSLYTLRSVAKKLEGVENDVTFDEKEIKFLVSCLGNLPDNMYRGVVRVKALDILDPDGKYEPKEA